MKRLSENVFYDSASAHRWDDLNETVFLERVLAQLEDMMGAEFLDYKFFILSAPDGDVRPDSVSDPSPAKVLIFISDESASVPSHLQRHYLAIFKSYLPCERPGSNVFPFSVGYVRDVRELPIKPIDDRTVDVFFSGNLRSSRLPLYRALHPVYRRLPRLVFQVAFSLFSRGYGAWLIPRDLSRSLPRSLLRFTDGFQKGLSREDYATFLADSRIVLCPPGASNPETFRHFEAMRAGAIVVSLALPDTHFYRGAPIVTVDGWKAGLARVRTLLRDEASLRSLNRATVSWWKQTCSEEATARYIHERLSELGPAAAAETPPSESASP